MSIEGTVFVLRLLSGLSLLGFLAALFAIIWRSMRQIAHQAEAAREIHGYLTMRRRDPKQPNSESARYPLYAITSLGCSGGNTIIVNDDFASGEHARIILEAGQWWLIDQHSREGTQLNDVAIKGRAALADGDVIGIGSLDYRLSLESERRR